MLYCSGLQHTDQIFGDCVTSCYVKLKTVLKCGHFIFYADDDIYDIVTYRFFLVEFYCPDYSRVVWSTIGLYRPDNVCINYNCFTIIIYVYLYFQYIPSLLMFEQLMSTRNKQCMIYLMDF